MKFPDVVINEVWSSLEEEHRKPWRTYCEEARRVPGTPTPTLRGEARTRLFVENRRWEKENSDEYNPRVEATLREVRIRYGDDHTVEEFFDQFEITFGSIHFY